MSNIIRTDNLTPDDRIRTMQSVHSVDTSPEKVVRRLLYSMGYRYRLHRADLPGKPDIVFACRKKVIFVHGCFWHSHNCKAGNKRPKTNSTYWQTKLQKNCERDQRHQEQLQADGWQVFVVWECETKYRSLLQEKLLAFLENING